MRPRERAEDGTFRETVTLDSVRDVFEEVRGPVITSSDVADQLDCTTEAARQKLTRLYDQGEVDKRKTGRTVMYWKTGGDRITPEERAVTDHTEIAREQNERRGDGTGSTGEQRDCEAGGTPSTPNAGQTPSTDTEPDTSDTADTADAADALAGELREYLEATDQLPKTAHSRGVVLDVFQLLREQGTMSTGDFQETIYPDYTEHWGSARTMWNAIDRYLEDIPGIEKAGYGEWGYTSDERVRATLVDAQDPVTDSGVYDPTEEF